jgi:hypothetical protein
LSGDGYPDLELEIGNNYADLIDFIAMPLDPRVVEIFGTKRPFMVLIRPDNYIGFICAEVSSANLNDYLHGILGH